MATKKQKQKPRARPVDPARTVARLVKMLRASLAPEVRKQVTPATLEKNVAELLAVSVHLARARAASSVLKELGL